MRWVASFLLVFPLLVCSALQPMGLKGVLAGTWVESGKDQSSNVTASTEVIEVSLPGLPEGARPLRMVRIPAGSFIMGSTDSERGRYQNEGPVHPVTISYDFYMGETEVTQAQWSAAMQNNPASGYGRGNDYPVYNVSWNDCQSFIAALNALPGMSGFRLPSEAELEYACRSGTTTRFYFGDSLDCPDNCQDCAAGTLSGNRSDYMWYCESNDPAPAGTKPVGGKLPNGFGLYDMHGSVWEWCQDYWHYNYIQAPADGRPWLDVVGSDGYRVIRSGGWSFDAAACRSAMRTWLDTDYGYYFAGLRVVLDQGPSSVDNWELFR